MAQATHATAYTSRIEASGTLLSDYILRSPEGKAPSELIILLHGYTLTARSLHDWLSAILPKDAAWLALNGPYPVPERVGDGFRVGYAWYFYDAKADSYLYDESNSVNLIRQTIGKLGLADLPKRVIGYSQGGYLAPKVGAGISGVKQVLGIACRFHEEEIDGVPSFRLDQVHGEKDEQVDFEPSRASHRALVARGAKGEYFSDPASGHRMTPEMIELTQKALGLI